MYLGLTLMSDCSRLTASPITDRLRRISISVAVELLLLPASMGDRLESLLDSICSVVLAW